MTISKKNQLCKKLFAQVCTQVSSAQVSRFGIRTAKDKSTAAIFSSSLPICPIYFHLIMPKHVLNPCYARYEHTRGIMGHVTYYLACYVRLQVQNMRYNMRL
jgi:hypothetical protein